MAPLRPFVAAALAAIPLAPAQQAIALTTDIDGGVSYPFDARMVPKSGITVEAWVTYDDTTIPTGANYWPTIARQNTSPGLENWNLRVDAGSSGIRQLRFYVRTAAGTRSATYQFASGELAIPTHVAGTYDGQTVRLYENGVQVGTSATLSLSPLTTSPGELRLGNGDPIAPGKEAWNGTIDELRIWPMARSAEIARTQDFEVYAMPEVLTFHLNGSYDDEYGQVLGSPFGTVNLVASPAPIVPIGSQVAQVGQPTSTCVRQCRLLVGSVPLAGNLDYTFWGVDGPPPAQSFVGLVAAAAAAAPAGQPPVLGIDLAFDLPSFLVSQTLYPATDALGTAKYALPLQSGPSLVGITWLFQFVFLDTFCGPADFSSSNGVIFTIQ